MKILFLITGLGVGGAERQVIDLADEMDARGHTVRIAYMVGEALLTPRSTSVRVIALGHKKDPFSMVLVFVRYIKLLREERPEVVHSHMFHANILARISRIFIKIPKLISTAHSTNEGSWVRMLIYRLTNMLSDKFTNVSEKAVIEFERRKAVAAGSMICMPNGIDTEKFCFNQIARDQLRTPEIEPECKLVLAVGRFVEAKNYPALLNAFSVVVASFPTLRLWIAGDGPLKAELITLIEELNIQHLVRLLGVRDDVSDLMSAADIFVLSSKWEGFGLVVAEAMAVERVVVATDCGGIAQVLGNCGYLVPNLDAAALALSIEAAARLGCEQSSFLGKCARSRVDENFSLDTIVTKWLLLYSK